MSPACRRCAKPQEDWRLCPACIACLSGACEVCKEPVTDSDVMGWLSERPAHQDCCDTYLDIIDAARVGRSA